MRQIVLSAILLSLTATLGADIGDVWDAKTQWSDENNPNILDAAPFGIWSYRNSGGGLLLNSPDGTIGNAPGGWSAYGSIYTYPSLFDNQWSVIQDPNTEFSGHGPWMVRWKSPVNGVVEVRGSLVQFLNSGDA